MFNSNFFVMSFLMSFECQNCKVLRYYYHVTVELIFYGHEQFYLTYFNANSTLNITL